MFYFILSILISFYPAAQNRQKSSYIEWSEDRKLTWNDFMADTPRVASASALASTAIRIDWGYYSDSLRYHIHCRFDRDSSWAKVKNDYILAHEQGHFDLTEIYARRLNRALKQYHADEKNFRVGVNDIYQEMMRQYSEGQDRYDHETNFSRNHSEEQNWLAKITLELDLLKGHADYH